MACSTVSQQTEIQMQTHMHRWSNEQDHQALLKANYCPQASATFEESRQVKMLHNFYTGLSTNDAKVIFSK